MTPDERQRARDRAADAAAPRSAVIVAPEGWPTSRRMLIGLSASQRRQFYRDRARKAAAS